MKPYLIGAVAVIAFMAIVSMILGSPWGKEEARRLEALNDSLESEADADSAQIKSLLDRTAALTLANVFSRSAASQAVDSAAAADQRADEAVSEARRLRNAPQPDTTVIFAAYERRVEQDSIVKSQQAVAIDSLEAVVVRDSVIIADHVTRWDEHLALDVTRYAAKDSLVAFWKEAAQPSPLVSLLGFKIDVYFGPQITVGPDLIDGGIAVAPGAGLHLRISR